jgi:hypothetical protein
MPAFAGKAMIGMGLFPIGRRINPNVTARASGCHRDL